MSKNNKKTRVNKQRGFDSKKPVLRTTYADFEERTTGKCIRFKITNAPDCFIDNFDLVAKLVDKAFDIGKFSKNDMSLILSGLIHFSQVSDERDSFKDYLNLMLENSSEREFLDCMSMTIFTSKLLGTTVEAQER